MTPNSQTAAAANLTHWLQQMADDVPGAAHGVYEVLYKELHLVPYLEPQWSLMLTIAFLCGAILFSLWKTSGKEATH